MLFFPGIDDVYHAAQFPRCMISINRLWKRKLDIFPNDWILDSGAFTTVTKYGGYPKNLLPRYASAVNRWARCGNLLAAVSQDYMCEPFVLKRTGLTVRLHQELTVSRYKALRKLIEPSIYLMPVIQGYKPEEYVDHIRQYEELLQPGQWVGVGSVCKRNSKVDSVEAVLMAIKTERPDLKLHGFGIKLTALKSQIVQHCLHSSDSMAWSFAARYEGRDAHDPQEAIAYVKKVNTCPIQMNLFLVDN